jgi:formate hydrogenlyase subunit 3/multisubunit Na+/H+ antiporter MnhD subunit
MPITSGCFLLGALAIAGFRRSMALEQANHLSCPGEGRAVVGSIIAVAVNILTMAVMVRAGFRVFWETLARLCSGAVAEGSAGRHVGADGNSWALCLLLGVYLELPIPCWIVLPSFWRP